MNFTGWPATLKSEGVAHFVFSFGASRICATDRWQLGTLSNQSLTSNVKISIYRYVINRRNSIAKPSNLLHCPGDKEKVAKRSQWVPQSWDPQFAPPTPEKV